LILFDLEESNNNTTTDNDLVKDILDKISPSNDLLVVTMRLGKRQQGRPRPLRVSLPSKLDALRILRNKSRYSGPVKIVQDQTLMQKSFLKDRARLS